MIKYIYEPELTKLLGECIIIMSKSEILNKVLAMSLAVMSFVPAAGAVKSGDESSQPPKKVSKVSNMPVRSEEEKAKWNRLFTLLHVGALCGQKRVRKYVRNNSKANPSIRALRYLFKVLRRREKFDGARFRGSVNILCANLVDENKEYNDKNIEALTSKCFLKLKGESSIADKIIDKDELFSKDGFTIYCDGNILYGYSLKDFEEVRSRDGKEYELTVIEIPGMSVKTFENDEEDRRIYIKQDNEEWCRYSNGKMEPLSMEDFNEFFVKHKFYGDIRLVYSVK